MQKVKAIIAATCCAAALSVSAKTPAEKLGWDLSMQSFTLHEVDAQKAIDMTAELGIKFIEIYPGHKMGPGFGDAVFGVDLTADQRDRIKKYAKDKGVRISGSGVWVAPREDWPKIFEFAKDMGLDYITLEPAREDWDVIEELSQKTGVKASTHNHPNPESYWSADELLKFIGDRDKKLGSCADVGHYTRMNLDHMAQLRKLDGRIISFHFKDVKPMPDGTYEDCVWGEGILDLDGMLAEMKRQGFKGYVTVEYEAPDPNAMQSMAKSLENFDKAVRRLK